MPVWEKTVHNAYLVLDEVAYIGECNTTLLETNEAAGKWPGPKNGSATTVKRLPTPKPLPMPSTAEMRPATS